MDFKIANVLLYLFLAVIMALIVLGNSLVITAVLNQKRLRTPPNIVIFSLAVADLTVGLFIIPLQMRETVTGGPYQHWHYGRVLCWIWLTMDITLCSTSILHICAIAIDRYRSIHEGITYTSKRTIRSTIYLCICLWTFAIWIACEPVLGWNDWAGLQDTECRLPTNWGFIVHATFGGFFVPASVTVALYVKIFFKIKQNFNEQRKLTHPEGTIFRRTPTSENTRMAKEKKAAKTLGCIICAFCVCWMPFCVTILTYGFAGSEYVNLNFYRFSTWLGYMNSALNPIIYTMLNHKFRSALQKLLKIRSRSIDLKDSPCEVKFIHVYSSHLSKK